MVIFDEFVSFYFSASIGINLLCAAVVTTSGLRQHPVYRTILLGCIISIMYQYSTWQFHVSLEPESAMMWLRIQTSIVIVSLPIMFLLFVQWSDQRMPRSGYIGMCVISAIFLTINLLSDGTLRFSGHVDLLRVPIFNGSEITRMLGDRTPGVYAFQLYAVALLVALIYLATKLFKQGKKLLGVLLIITLCIQIFASIMAIYMDSGRFNFFYLGGFAFTVLNFVACVTVATSLSIKRKSLKSEVVNREKLESVLSSLAKGVSSYDSLQFYKTMMTELQSLSQAKVCYIAMLDDNNETLTTKIVMHENTELENKRFYLRDIPTELMSGRQCTYVNADLKTLYPQFTLFKTVNAKSYVNAPMLDEQENLIGAIVLLSDEEVDEPTTLMQTLDVFRSRAAAEIQRDRLQNKLHQTAYFDHQTGLPNISKLHEQISFAYSQSLEEQTQSVLILIDLNKFTEINRDFGFAFAEACLKELGQRLSGYMQKDVSIARAGGDEFAVLISNVSMHAAGVAKLHWDALFEMIKKTIHVNGLSAELDACAGAVVFPEQVENAQEVLRCAEIALEQSKFTRHNEVTMFDAKILEEMDRRRKIEVGLLHALQENTELFPVYQPKVDQFGRLIGAEVLCRWISKDLGFVPPDEFIAVAESSGTIRELGLWMLGQVCKDINAWKEQGVEINGRIAVNVSSVQLIQEHFVEDVQKLISVHGITPDELELELTESGILSNLEDCINKLNALRELGFTVALDDFGTGYSSLSHLKDLPLDVLKIDRSFVNVIEEKRSSELARSIVTISHNMGLKTVAEGVEHVSHVDILARMGCDIYQGYHFAKPMKAEEFTEWAGAQDS
ncbi:EAL domain-containing protein [Glaciecola siphonariae]|uniref:EAL domain-containing protein n=1 Tax=Glaciecola siphonariae TaxID=521012 RepID=A0ABV9LVH6_9ALTE